MRRFWQTKSLLERKMQRHAAIFISRGRAQDHESLRRFLLTE
jgi:hypothetical protein